MKQRTDTTVKVKLANGGEIQVELDLIQEYGSCFDVIERGGPQPADPWPGYIATRKWCYMKVYGYFEKIIITRESLEEIHKLKTQQK